MNTMDICSSILRPATLSDRAVISNLLQLYLYDMASANYFPISPNGAYDYDFLDRFWEHPYLLYDQDMLIGFALVTSSCQITERSPCWFMGEFFVLRPHRRKGLGDRAVKEILSRHPGQWHLTNLVENTGADGFWSRVLPDDAEERGLRFDGDDWTLRTFVS
ncbi:hypothetical protein DL239_17195 [Sedimentitalea sp. CY04]|uniref:N-acetyltransferase domain-containing protein n=1 Tax=Parasedimentitalea denitrificans TaxID=2211118 RepID=A0ABX0WAK9_9RHOB|nr:GNAT family N-acetyltransferase [Sedimentitalea sp. CY04]NIZ62711.1 hypothetical protein [Sedimentitalea sp. CY04]